MKPLITLLFLMGAMPIIATLWLAMDWYGFNRVNISAIQWLLVSNSLVIGAALIAIPLFIYQDIRGKQP